MPKKPTKSFEELGDELRPLFQQIGHEIAKALYLPEICGRLEKFLRRILRKPNG